MDTVQFRVYTLDVWGNHKDGFDVNQIHRTFTTIWIPEDILYTEKSLLTFLKRKEIIDRSARRSRWTRVDYSGFVSDNNLEIDFDYNGRPSFMLRQEDISRERGAGYIARTRDFQGAK